MKKREKKSSFSLNPFLRPILLMLATGFYTGYIPLLSGTAGTLVGAILYLLLNGLGPWYYLILGFLFFLGVWISGWAERYFQQKDCRKIVIDEVVGFMVAMGTIKMSFSLDPFLISRFKLLLAGFLLFRIFDIMKPYPIRRLELLKSGWGVMLDDALAGVYTFIMLSGIRALFPGIQ